MPLTLTIDRDRWTAHQRGLLAEMPGLIPVAKGNGYGFGLPLLARQATALGLDTIAVGIAQEVDQVRSGGWDGDVVVLNPWRPFDAFASTQLGDPSLIVTLSRAEDLHALATAHPGTRVLLEIETSMHRHGLQPGEVSPDDLAAVRFEGWSVHLPADGSLEEARRLTRAGLDVAAGPVWVSHLSQADYRVLHAELDGAARIRVGTRLWLGDKAAYRTTGTVLDVHPVRKGQPLGYHQGRAPRDGHLLVISGGTAHGVAMAAPVPQRSLRQRAVTLLEGTREAIGRSLSPYGIGGRKRDFAEPPHMHSSMVFVPGPDPHAQVGDEVPVTTRMTTVSTDEIVWR